MKRRTSEELLHDESHLTEAREMLEAQKPRLPQSLSEAHEATDAVFLCVEGILDRGPMFDVWTQETDALEEEFFENGGALGRQLLEYATCTPEAFEIHREEAKRIISLTALHAIRMYPVIHRLRTLGFGVSRTDAVDRLSVGVTNRTERVQGIPITPSVTSLLGLLRIVDARVNPEDERVWSLEIPPELPKIVAIVRDPFGLNDEEIRVALREKTLAKREVNGGEMPKVLTMSRDVTHVLAYELAQVHESSPYENVRTACDTLLSYLERKDVYYQNPDIRDFATYHLGMEDPADIQAILSALDVLKHHDPEWFCEMLGMNTQDNTRSAYFGSFLHKAIYNTQRVISGADTLTDLVLREQITSLLTLDAHVQTYAGTVSKDQLAHMRRSLEEHVQSEATPEGKGQSLLISAIPYTIATIDAEIRQQLEKLREYSHEKVYEELVRHLDDVEHPLKTMEYIAQMPKYAFANPLVRNEFARRFQFNQHFFENPSSINGMTWYESIQHDCRYQRGYFVGKLYCQIPLFDMARPDFAWGNRARVMERDAKSITGRFDFLRRGTNAVFGDDVGNVAGNAFVSSIQGMSGVPFSQTTNVFIKNKLEFLYFEDTYHSGVLDFGFERDAKIQATKEKIRKWCEASGGDISYITGQAIMGVWTNDATKLKKDLVERYRIIREYFVCLPEFLVDCDPEKVFLSILAHPEGQDVAFGLFDVFCKHIPEERMMAILYDDSVEGVKHPAIEKFRKRCFPTWNFSEKKQEKRASRLPFLFLERAMNQIMESSGTSERFDFSHETLAIPEYWTSEHDKVIAEFFGWDDARGDVAITCMPSPEALRNLDDAYLDAFYPTTKREEPYLAFRPTWFARSAVGMETTGGREAYPGKTFWDVYKNTMLESAQTLAGARIFIDAARKPRYTGDTQAYTYPSGSSDPIPAFLQEYLHKVPPVTHRLFLTHGELDGFCMFLKRKIITHIRSKNLEVHEGDIGVQLPPAFLMNILMCTSDAFYPSSKTDTWEWTGDIVTSASGDSLKVPRALMVGNSDGGGAAYLDSGNRYVRYAIRGFRPAVIVRKRT